MDKRKLGSLLSRSEGTKLDYKLKIDIHTESGKKEFAKDVCAIANSKGGRGYIIIGVEDKTRELVGINGEYLKEETLQQVISSRCNPPIPITYEVVNYKDKELGIITIYSSNQKPYQVKESGAFFIRRGSTTDTMRKEEFVSCIFEGLNFNHEICPILNSSDKYLDLELVDKYFQLKGISVNEENRIEFMDSLGITCYNSETSNRMVTLGGLLIFSHCNSMFLPQNMVKIINKLGSKGKGCENIIVIQGNLLDILDKAEEEIKKALPEEYPVQSVVEAVNNAVLYRDYSLYTMEIEVVINRNSVVVSSPGAVENGNRLKSSSYVKRNMWLYEKLICLDHKKRYLKTTPGFTIMKRQFKNKGKIIFINSYDNNVYKVVFPGPKKIILKNN